MPDSFNPFYDYLFVGLGAANSLLILRLHDEGLLVGKKIAIIEPDTKAINDRVFCFWATDEELAELHVQSLVSKRWDHIEINGVTKQAIQPLHYCHVQSIDLYTSTKKILLDYAVEQFSARLTENPKQVGDAFEVRIDQQTILANRVFDSRPPQYHPTQEHESHLIQSFYGWKIKAQTNAFDSTTMVMMDFEVPQNNFTQFVYKLPFSEDTALIELTRFGKDVLTEAEANSILSSYIAGLGISFEVLDVEHGLIPMSSAAMQRNDFGPHWIHMGVAANMLKSSTGYAFHFMAEDAQMQMENIKNDTNSLRPERASRFRFYDRLLLKILHASPQYGKLIFQTLFREVPIPTVLRFLREKTSLKEEGIIFSKLPITIFLKTAVKDIFYRLPLFPLLLTLLSLFFSFIHAEKLTYSLLGAGFVTIGLSHGALDHLPSGSMASVKKMAFFIVNYLFRGALVGIVWWLLPDLGLGIFIGYSAWHFGQADYKEWGLRANWQAFLWGFSVLGMLLFFHSDELTWILGQIPGLQTDGFLQKIKPDQFLPIQISFVLLGLILAFVHKSLKLFMTIGYVLLASYLPLLVSFGIYFVFQHSFYGWRHLRQELVMTSKQLYVQSLPFALGGMAIIAYFLLVAGVNYLGMFFIILSCLSIPHVLLMHRFYTLR